MDKAFILDEIRRTAESNGNKPYGQKRADSELGIKASHWRGIYRARWGDALIEAGYSPNDWIRSYDDEFVLEKLILAVRRYGRFPAKSELDLYRREVTDFPSYRALTGLGGKCGAAAKLMEYCQNRGDCGDVVEICQSLASQTDKHTTRAEAGDPVPSDGYVYLLKSGRHYKIGRTNAHGRREYELAIQLPERAEKVHVIATDDPVGIEAYWHNRFAEKRKNGEWFELSAADIKAFKRRKFM